MDRLSDTKPYDVAAIKARLNRYRETERDIDNQIERLERLTVKMTTVGAQVISDIPKAPGPSNDRLSILVDRKDRLDGKLREAINEQNREWNSIEEILAELDSSDEKAIIRMRYHDCEDWNTVSFLVYGNRDDYAEREESYQRTMYRVHGRALMNMARAIENRTDIQNGPRYTKHPNRKQRD